MAILPSEIVIKTSEYRPCIIGGDGGLKALFHCWCHKSEAVSESPLRGGHPAGIISSTFGIVEFEDGKVQEVYPHVIRFCDNKMDEYCFKNKI